MLIKRNSIIFEQVKRLLNKIFGASSGYDAEDLYDMCIDITNRKIEITSEIDGLLDVIENTDDQTLCQRNMNYLTNLRNEMEALESLYDIYSKRAEMMLEDMKQKKE